MRTTAWWSRRGWVAAWPLAVVSTIIVAVVLAGQGAAIAAPTPETPAAAADPVLTSASATPTATPAAASPTPSVAVPASAAPAPAAPAPTATATPTSEAAETAPAETATPETAAPTPTVTPTATALTVSSIVLARVPGTSDTAAYLAPGTDVTGAQPFDTFRVGVLVANATAGALAWTPQVEFRRAGDAEFTVAPVQATPGVALHAAQEWVEVPGGTEVGPDAVVIDIPHLTPPEGLTSAPGRRVSGVNPDAAVSVPAGVAVEQEFTVRLGLDAVSGAGYEVRVTDAGVPLGASQARIVLAEAGAIETSPGQRSGVPSEPRYQLALPQAAAAPMQLTGIQVVPDGTDLRVHQQGSAQCATCHSAHTSSSQALIRAESQTAQCYTCHDAAGLGGAPNTEADFEQSKPNDEATRSYYSHDLSTPGHLLDTDDQFAGVLNRHSQCADCHNPHNVSETAPFGVSGVAVENGPAGTAPTYTRLDGRAEPITAEYQLCFKCHSGWTQQLSNDPAAPSRDRTDLGVAFNPNNASYHPIQAPGKNQTQKMADSLAGTSSYKLWDLQTTDTIRCVMCHTSSTLQAGTAPDATLTVHASENRGILVRPYENRVLSARGTAYDAAGFALCLACHAETPFMNPSGPGATTATNFDFHGLHTAGISMRGSGGTDIDVAGAGQGNARCAECHFRSHGPSDVPGQQSLDGTGLVTFAPNVTRSSAMASVPVTFVKTATGGSCTLTCHGKDHQGLSYVSP